MDIMNLVKFFVDRSLVAFTLVVAQRFFDLYGSIGNYVGSLNLFIVT